jgi:tRNA (cytidine/uridine-2'-O-)-methyltransferase
MNLPDIVLFRPEIPPNTGNIIRLAANTGAELHLIHPLGFALNDRELRRAGLDYAEYARVHEHASLADYLAAQQPHRLFALSVRGRTRYCDAAITGEDALLYGPETAGLPQEILASLPATQRLYLPMRAPSRSMNLANSVAVVVYDTWRRLGFAGAHQAPG